MLVLMFEQIRELAQQLGIREGQLASLAREVAQDCQLRDLEYMRAEDAASLLRFLKRQQARELVTVA